MEEIIPAALFDRFDDYPEGDVEVVFTVHLKGWGRYRVVAEQQRLFLARALFSAFEDNYEMYDEAGRQVVFDHLSDDMGHHEHTGHLAENAIVLKRH